MDSLCGAGLRRRSTRTSRCGAACGCAAGVGSILPGYRLTTDVVTVHVMTWRTMCCLVSPVLYKLVRQSTVPSLMCVERNPPCCHSRQRQCRVNATMPNRHRRYPKLNLRLRSLQSWQPSRPMRHESLTRIRMSGKHSLLMCVPLSRKAPYTTVSHLHAI